MQPFTLFSFNFLACGFVLVDLKIIIIIIFVYKKKRKKERKKKERRRKKERIPVKYKSADIMSGGLVIVFIFTCISIFVDD